MKRLFLALALILIAAPAMAGQVTLAWEQDAESLTSLSHWSLKVRSEPTGAIEQTIDVPYSGETDLTFTSTQDIGVTGDPGAYGSDILF